MDDEITKKRAAILSNDKKHSFEIIRDYKRRILYKVLAVFLLGIGVLAIIFLSRVGRGGLGLLLLVLTFATSGILMLIQLKCAVCDNIRALFREEKVGRFNSKETLICSDCRLTAIEMSRYIGMLKSGIEINEENVTQIIDED